VIRTFLRAALAGAAALTFAVPAAQATTPAGWLSSGSDPSAVLAALDAHRDKVPAEFNERLEYALPDGTLRVMLVAERRDAATEALAASATTWLQWFGDSRTAYARVTPDQLTRLLEAPAISFVEPDYRIRLSLAVSAGDVHARSTAAAAGIWSFDAAAGPRGALGSAFTGLSADAVTGKGVTVAVVDGGIDGTHRDFGGWDCTPSPYQPCESRIKEHATLTALNSGIDLPAETTNDIAGGHGTHVAGIIAGNGFTARDYQPAAADVTTYGGDGRPIGIAPQASLVSVKNGELIWAGLGVQGLQWVKSNAQRLGIRVANNSWGCLGGCAYNASSAEAVAQRDLYRAGVLVTFAAGNDGGSGNGSSFSGDSQSPYVLSVANYDAATHQLASSSSRGSSAAALPAAATWDPDTEPSAGYRRPDIAAPGENIWSTRSLTGGAASLVPRQSTGDVIGGENLCCIRDYAVMSGTSMAAPHVAGAAADLFSACPPARVLDVMRALLAGADATRVKKTGSTTTAQAFEVGYGGLDLRASLTWLKTNVSGCA
jgi:serine protease AprX